MDKVYIYCRFLVLASHGGGWWKYYKRPLTIEKAKARLAKLRAVNKYMVFCMAGDDLRIVKE